MFNSLTDYIRTSITNFLFPDDNPQHTAMLAKYQQHKNYYSGRQKQPLTVKPNQANDNLIVNFIGLVVERSISLLFGSGIKFDLPGEGETPEQAYIDLVWQANKQGILLNKAAQLAAIYGTGYFKIMPGALSVKGQQYPRLVALHPEQLQIMCEPDDMETVMQYVIRYVTTEGGEQVAHKEVTMRVYAMAQTMEGQPMATRETAYWTVSHYIASRLTGGRFVQQFTYDWPYTFPPILHWQNLPDAEDCCGKSDICDILEVQDRYNFVDSNISKIIRYHAHPKTWARGISAGKTASWGADEMVQVNGPDAMVSNLEMQTDLSSSRAFALDLRQALFDISRTVDITSITDKIGALTNFGLRVLYMDALNKNSTKRELIGDALIELNRRLLILNGTDESVADGGAIVWPDPLPVNDAEQSQALTNDLNAGIVSKQTASTQRGYDWLTEEERIQADKASEQNVGSLVLTNFLNGGGGFGSNTGGNANA